MIVKEKVTLQSFVGMKEVQNDVNYVNGLNNKPFCHTILKVAISGSENKEKCS